MQHRMAIRADGPESPDDRYRIGVLYIDRPGIPLEVECIVSFGTREDQDSPRRLQEGVDGWLASAGPDFSLPDEVVAFETIRIVVASAPGHSDVGEDVPVVSMASIASEPVAALHAIGDADRSHYFTPRIPLTSLRDHQDTTTVMAYWPNAWSDAFLSRTSRIVDGSSVSDGLQSPSSLRSSSILPGRLSNNEYARLCHGTLFIWGNMFVPLT